MNILHTKHEYEKFVCNCSSEIISIRIAIFIACGILSLTYTRDRYAMEYQ